MDKAVKILQINNNLLHSCTFIFECKYLLLIDPGEPKPIIEHIKQTNKQLIAILLTHCHADHIYGIAEILKIYPNTPIYCSLSTLKGLFDNKQNLSFTIPDYPINIPHSLLVNIIEEGEYYINNLKVVVIETPGHSDDCLTYIIGEHIFTGDSFIPFCKVFAKWPRSQKDLASRNEKKLIEIINNNKYIVHPGHWQ